MIVFYSFPQGGTINFNIGEHYLKDDLDPEVIRKKFQAYVDAGQWRKWECRRGAYRNDGEDCNIYTIFLVWEK